MELNIFIGLAFIIGALTIHIILICQSLLYLKFFINFFIIIHYDVVSLIFTRIIIKAI